MIRTTVMRRLIPRIAVCLSIIGTDPQAVGARQGPLNSVLPSVPAQREFLDRHCVTCHNARLRTANLALDTIDVTDVRTAAPVWEKVIRKLRMGAMPPPGRPQPERAAVGALVSYLETSLDRAAAATPDPGRTDSVHRLNRTEYQNAIRDLLALDVDVAALLPADEAGQHGFDNMAGVLSVSPALVQHYVSAARKVSRLAVGLTPRPSVATYQVPLHLLQDHMRDDLPFGSRGGVAVRHYFPVDAEYVIKVHLQTNYVGYIRGLDAPHQIELRIDGVRVKQFTIGGDVPGREAPESYEGNILGDVEWEKYMQHADEGVEVRVPVPAGPRVVGVSFPQEQWEPDGVLQPRQTGFALAINAMTEDNPAVGSVSITGPHEATGPGDTPSRRAIFSCRPASRRVEDQCATSILSTLARRAYRREVAEREVQTLLGFYAQGRNKGSFESGIQLALERLLADPNFLFRIEGDPQGVRPGTPYRLGDFELASRLSFFLWSSIPDEELLDVAGRGELRQPPVLERQVRRMLADPRSGSLVSNFAGQWLLLRNMRSVYPDPKLFPHFDDNLREALQLETELFLQNELREDRSVTGLLEAEYSFVNERLARHYGIPNVYGNRFRRVPAGGNRQGGLLTHGSVLTVTSYPNRTSPVLRGKWLLENILGTPPPPPPPNVPTLPDRGEDGKPASVRERLQQHRKNPACAACHAPMDPLGFALENFDAIGGWRTTEANAPIDAAAALPNGRRFEGADGLTEILLAQRDQFVRTVTEKLLTYALGRGIEHYDWPAIRQIARDASADNYRWSAVILGIVQSVPFQMRRSGR
jgi:mono/diheme cytochrome c family protein